MCKNKVYLRKLVCEALYLSFKEFFNQLLNLWDSCGTSHKHQFINITFLKFGIF